MRSLQFPIVEATQQIPVEQRLAKDIMALASGATSLANLAVNVTADDINRHTTDLQTLMKFNDASSQAKKELGIAEIKQKQNEVNQSMAAIDTVSQWYNKLAEQERIGLPAMANGRTREELVNLMKANPGIVDPNNLLQYRNDVAKNLAMNDAPVIFDNMDRDAVNKVFAAGTPKDQVQQTIQKSLLGHLNDMVSSRSFPDEASKTAYLQTLLPIVARTNEQLMAKAWDIQRKDNANSLTSDLKFSFGIDIKNNNASYDNFKSYVDSYATKYKSFIPEATDEEIISNALKSASDVLTGPNKVVNPVQAQSVIDNLISQAKKPNEALTSWFNGLRAQNNQEVLAFQDANYSQLSSLVKTSPDRSALQQNMANSKSFAQDSNKLISNLQLNQLSTDYKSTLLGIQTKEIDDLKSRISLASSREELKELNDQAANGDYSKQQKDDLKKFTEDAIRTTLAAKLEYDDRVSKGNTNIIIGPEHDRFIDENFNKIIANPIPAPSSDINNYVKSSDQVLQSVPISKAYSQILEQTGTISKSMNQKINSMPDDMAIDTIIEMEKVNAPFVKNLVGEANPNDSLKISPRAYVAARMVTDMGFSSADVKRTLANTTNETFMKAWSSFTTPAPVDLVSIKPAPTEVKEALGEGWFTFEPSEVSTELIKKYQTAATANYVNRAANGLIGADHPSLLKDSRDSAKNFIKSKGVTFKINGTKYGVQNHGEFNAVKSKGIDSHQLWRNYGEIISEMQRVAVADLQLDSQSLPDINSISFDQNNNISMNFIIPNAQRTVEGTVKFSVLDMGKLMTSLESIQNINRYNPESMNRDEAFKNVREIYKRNVTK